MFLGRIHAEVLLKHIAVAIPLSIQAPGMGDLLRVGS